jgi:cytochrome P450
MAVAALLARYPDLRLAEPDAAPKWRPQSFFHGLEELEVLT